MIDQMTVDKIMTGQKVVIDEPVDAEKGLFAKISIKMNDEKQIKIHAHLRSKTESHVDAAGDSRKTSQIDTLKYDVKAVVGRLMARYMAATRPAVEHHHRSKDLAAAVLALPEILDPQTYFPYTKTSKLWAKTTTEQAVKYFVHTISEVYKVYGDHPTEDDFVAFYWGEVERIYNTKYTRPCADGDIVRQRRESIYNQLLSRVQRAGIVHQYLTSKHPELGLPTTPVFVPLRFRQARIEEVKSIPYEVYMKVIALVIEHCRHGDPYGYAAVMLVFCALRIGESCAPLIGDFEDLGGGVGRYYVGYQIDGHGKRTNQLKTQSSYRYVFFGQRVLEIIEMRKQRLRDGGYSEKEIMKMPFAAKENDPFAFVSKEKASRFVQELLLEAGCNKVWISAVASEIGIEDDDLAVSAHLLRRTLATYWCSGGVAPDTVDALLGHTNAQSKNKRKDYASVDSARRIEAQIERAANLDLFSGVNPAYQAAMIGHPQMIHMDGNSRYIFCTDRDCCVQLQLTALEPAGNIRLHLPSGVEPDIVTVGSVTDTTDSRVGRPIPPLLRENRNIAAENQPCPSKQDSLLENENKSSKKSEGENENEKEPDKSDKGTGCDQNGNEIRGDADKH